MMKLDQKCCQHLICCFQQGQVAAAANTPGCKKNKIKKKPDSQAVTLTLSTLPAPQTVVTRNKLLSDANVAS